MFWTNLETRDTDSNMLQEPELVQSDFDQTDVVLANDETGKPFAYGQLLLGMCSQVVCWDFMLAGHLA